ncbi:hypothetical protein CcCBS67573_g09986 [Chytriomyces confervae]|uniref:Uncharacterized protein n=1 Tax=Chytriomyces confervae TaxID=246404 RepID=A0A507DK86_9FUNG|nr:hypothetical protein CcCBS67573_g09986 [Chytriomyces confervae]
MLAAIGKGNVRTLSLEFTPFVNCFLRPVPPTRWAQGLILAKEFQDEEDSDSSSNSDKQQHYQKQAKDNKDAIKYTLIAIYRRLLKSMQAQYAFHDTPAFLWEESRKTNHIKCIHEVEDACTAAGKTLHLGLEAQLKVRYCLDYRFTQTVMVLRALRHTKVINAERLMIDLWDGYKAALKLNNPAESKTKPTANVTISNPDRKH